MAFRGQVVYAGIEKGVLYRVKALEGDGGPLSQACVITDS